MRLLILGGNGMLGHKLFQQCSDRFETWATVRSSGHRLLHPARTLSGIDVFDFDSVVRAFDAAQPEVVVNCIGIVKQLPAANDAVASITVNALFPHRLAALCRSAGIRLIHISSDCVFSGRQGMYRETDPPDAQDLYGRSKLLGELDQVNCLTLRTSFIGRELGSSIGLVEWFLKNTSPAVQGYTNAIFSGLTTAALGDVIIEVIQSRRELSGLFHLSSEPISKFNLLSLIRDAFDLQVDIQPSGTVRIDRSLDSTRFRAVTGFCPQTWPQMVASLAADRSFYE